MMHGAFEDAVVVGPAGGDHMVAGGLGGIGLQQFLEFPFWIFENWNDRQFAEGAEELPQDKLPRGLEAAIKKDGAQERLERVGKRRWPVATARNLFPAADQQMAAQADLTGAFGKAAAVDQLGARLGERALSKSGKFFIELLSQHELENRIAQEFEPLIGLNRQPLLVGH